MATRLITPTRETPQVWAMTDLKQQDIPEDTKVPTNATDGEGPVTTRRAAARAEIIVPTPPPPAPIQRPLSPEEIVDSLRFMFAVGIECSNPVVQGNVRVDQLEATGHYDNWRKDLRLVRN